MGGLRAYQYWNDQLSRKTLEYRLDNNPPRAARAFMLPFVTLYDIGIACWEAKYTYSAIRPSSSTRMSNRCSRHPNHPSYPAAHACASISATRMLGYLFPRDADAFAALGERAAEFGASGAGITIAATSSPDASSLLRLSIKSSSAQRRTVRDRCGAPEPAKACEMLHEGPGTGAWPHAGG